MNGIGIGLAVGLGALASALLLAPGAEPVEYVGTFVFYAWWSGFLFELYRLALSTQRPPFGR
jgi:hypothetical protein